MSTPIVSLGNGAWVAKNITLTNTYQYNDGWTPEQPSTSDVYNQAAIDLDGINETSATLQGFSDADVGYSLTWRGFLRIEQSGEYVFNTESDDGVILSVQATANDGSPSSVLTTISDWDNSGGQTNVSNSSSVNLNEGDVVYFDLSYFQDVSSANLKLQWQINDEEAVIIPSNQIFLSHAAASGGVLIEEPTSVADNKSSFKVYATDNSLSSLQVEPTNQSGLSQSTFLKTSAYLDIDGGNTANHDLAFVSSSGNYLSSPIDSVWTIPVDFSSTFSNGFEVYEEEINVAVFQDSYAELDESLGLTLSSDSNYINSNQQIQVLTIPSNGPVASLSPKQSATEGNYGWFDLNLSEPSVGALSGTGKWQIPYTIQSGTSAVLGEDYLLPLSVANTLNYSADQFVFFDSGKSNISFYVTALQDQIDEPTETLEVELLNHSVKDTTGFEFANYLVDTNPSAVLDILDAGKSPAQVLLLSPDRNGSTVIQAQQQNGIESATIRVQLNSKPRQDVAVSLTSESGQFVSTGFLSTEYDLTFTPDNWFTGQNITLTNLSDSALTTLTATSSSFDSNYDDLASVLAIAPSNWQDNIVVSMTEGGSEISSLPSLSVSSLDGDEKSSSAFGFLIKTNSVDLNNDLQVVYQLSTSDDSGFQFGGTGLSLYRLFDYTPSIGVIGLNTENDEFDYFSVDNNGLNKNNADIKDFAINGEGNIGLRWEGYISIPTSGNYTFKAVSNDGVSVTLKDQSSDGTVLDSFSEWDSPNQGTSQTSSGTTLTLKSGDIVWIQYDYYTTSENSNATAQLLWDRPDGSGGTVSNEVIPNTSLYLDSSLEAFSDTPTDAIHKPAGSISSGYVATLPAGSESLLVDLLPVSDNLAEQAEQVTLTLIQPSGSDPTYTVSNQSSIATATLSDANQAAFQFLVQTGTSSDGDPIWSPVDDLAIGSATVSGAKSATIGIQLTSLPHADVSMMLNEQSYTADDLSVSSSDSTGDEVQFTFTRDNWNEIQTLVLESVNTNSTANSNQNLSFSIASDDSKYADLNTASFNVTIANDSNTTTVAPSNQAAMSQDPLIASISPGSVNTIDESPSSSAPQSTNYVISISEASTDQTVVFFDIDPRYSEATLNDVQYSIDSNNQLTGLSIHTPAFSTVDNTGINETTATFSDYGLSGDFTVSWSGYVYAPEDGNYQFFADVTGGVTVDLGGQTVIDQSGDNQASYSSELVFLNQGEYTPIVVTYDSMDNINPAINLEWTRPDITGTTSEKEEVVPNQYFSRVSDFHVVIPAGETSAEVSVTAVDDYFAEDNETFTPALNFSGGVNLIVQSQTYNSSADNYTLELLMNEFDRDSISLPAGTTLAFTDNNYESTTNSNEPIANFVLNSGMTINQVGPAQVEGTLTWTSTGEDSNYSSSVVGLTAAAPINNYQVMDSSVTLTLVDDFVESGSSYAATFSFDPSISNLSKFTLAEGTVFNYSIQNDDNTTDLFTLTTSEAVSFDQQAAQQTVLVDVSTATNGLDITTLGKGLTSEYGIPLVSEISIQNDASRGTAGLVFSSDSSGDDLISDGSNVSLDEDGGSIERWVRLNSQPRESVNVFVEVDDAVNVSLQQGNGGESSDDGLIKLTFTPGNWDTFQSFTILGNDNDEVDGDRTISLATMVSSEDTFYTPSNSDFLDAPSQTVSIEDDDSASVLLQIEQINIVSSGNNFLDLSLSAKPKSDVVVSLMPSNSQFSVGTAGVGNSESVTFTSSNWSEVQSVELLAIDDDDVNDGIVNGTLTLASTSDDSAFDGLDIPVVSVDIIDNDLPTATLKPVTISATENAKPGLFVVELSSQASNSEGDQGVWVNYSVSDIDYQTGLYQEDAPPNDSDISNFTQIPGSLTGKVWIAPGDQTSNVIVVPIDDAVADSQGKSFEVAIDDGNGYVVGDANSTASIQIINDDVAGVVVQSTGQLTASEGIIGDPDAVVAGSFDISLLSQPTEDVIITFTTSDADNVSMALKSDSNPGYANDPSTSISEESDSPFSITFSAENWMIPQSVNLYANNDDEINFSNDGIKPITINLNYSGDSGYTAINESSSASAYQSFPASIKDLQFPDSTAVSIQNALLSVQDGLENVEAPFVGELEGKIGQGVNRFLPSLYAALVHTNPTAAQLSSILNSVINTGSNQFTQTIDFINNSDDLNVQFAYSDSSELASVPLGSDLGLGPLGFKSSGDFEAIFDAINSINIVVPVNGDSPYIQTDFSPDALTGTGSQASFDASLDDFEFEGGLGYLQLNAKGSSFTNSAGESVTTGLDFDVDLHLQPSSATTNSVIEDYQYEFTGDAGLAIDVETNVAGSAAIPSFSFNLSSLLFSADEGAAASSLYGSSDFYFDNIKMDLGSYISGMMSPIVDSLNDVLEPIYPIIDALYADTHIFSSLGLEGIFSDDGVVTTLDLATWFAEATGDEDLVDDVKEAEQFIGYIKDFLDLVQSLEQMEQQGDFYIDYGNYTLAAFDPGSSAGPSNDCGDDCPDLNAGSSTNSTTQQAMNGGSSSNGSSSKVFSELMNDFYGLGVGIPLIDNPVNVIELLLGQTADLFTLTLPTMALTAEVEEDFPIWGGVEGVIEGGLTTGTNLSFGFDSSGLQAWAEAGFKESDFSKVFDGFYVVDSPGPEFQLDATMGAGLDLNAVVVDASIIGGLEAGASLDLLDQGEISGTSDGKIYGDELIAGLANPSSLFNIVGDLAAFLQAKVRVGFHLGFIKFMRTVWEQNLAEIPIFEFDLSGTSSSGTASNGYLVGTSIFLDGNQNGSPDSYEPSTVTGTDASFSLRADHNSFDRDSNGHVDAYEGRLVAHGGVDTSSGHKLLVPLIAPVGSEMITPLTSLVQASLELGLSMDEAQSWINEAFDLQSFDVLRQDPVLELSRSKQWNLQSNLRAYSAHNVLHFSLDVLHQAIHAVLPDSSPKTLAEKVDLVSTFSSAVVAHSPKLPVNRLLRRGFKAVKRDLSSCLNSDDLAILHQAVSAAEIGALEFEARVSHQVAKADRSGFEQSDLKKLLANIDTLKQKTFERYRSRFAASGEGLHRIDDPVALQDEIATRLGTVHGDFIKRSVIDRPGDRVDPKNVQLIDSLRGKSTNVNKVALDSTDGSSRLNIHQPVSRIRVRFSGDRSMMRGKTLQDSTVQVGHDGDSRLVNKLPLIRNSVFRATGGSNVALDLKGDRLTGVTAHFGRGNDRLFLSSGSSLRRGSQFNLGHGADVARLDGEIGTAIIDLGSDRRKDRVILGDLNQVNGALTISNIGPNDLLKIGNRSYSGSDLLDMDMNGILFSYQDDLFCGG